MFKICLSTCACFFANPSFIPCKKQGRWMKSPWQHVLAYFLSMGSAYIKFNLDNRVNLFKTRILALNIALWFLEQEVNRTISIMVWKFEIKLFLIRSINQSINNLRVWKKIMPSMEWMIRRSGEFIMVIEKGQYNEIHVTLT